MGDDHETEVTGMQCSDAPKKGREDVTGWDSLSSDLLENIFLKLRYEDLFRCKAVSKACKESIGSDRFRQSQEGRREGTFAAINYTIKNNTWQWCGYDVESNSWRSLPTYSSCLPSPGLFKEFSVSGHRSLMCGHVSKLSKKGELVVFNPLTGRKRVLPPLLNPRTPVLVHISVDLDEGSYTVVAAGSSSGSGRLQRKVEVFCSTTSKWTEAGEVPRSAEPLYEHQTGVSIDGILYCIAYLKYRGRAVLAFDVKNRTWVEDLTCPIPFSLHSKILQLVECDGNLLVFSVQKVPGSVTHCIDLRLDSAYFASIGCAWDTANFATAGCASEWTNLLTTKKSGGLSRSPVYPEFTCVSFGEGKLCVFNNVRRDGVVFDLEDGNEIVLPPPPANQRGENFFTLNPASFTLQPSFCRDTFLELS